jgi:hypothetical protein
MTLQTSGTISFNDVNVEILGVGYGTDSNANLNHYKWRNASGVLGGEHGLDDLYGTQGGNDQQLITVGSTWISTGAGGAYGFRSFNPAGNYIGSCTDGTVNFRNGLAFFSCYYLTGYKTVTLILRGYSYSNTGFDKIEIRPEVLDGNSSTGGNTSVFQSYKSSATFSRGSYYNYTQWVWPNVNSNPFGTTNGHKKSVILRSL